MPWKAQPRTMYPPYQGDGSQGDTRRVQVLPHGGQFEMVRRGYNLQLKVSARVTSRLPRRRSTGGGRRRWRPPAGGWRSWPRRPASTVRLGALSRSRRLSPSHHSAFSLHWLMHLIGLISNWSSLSPLYCCRKFGKFQFVSSHPKLLCVLYDQTQYNEVTS